MGTAAVAAHLTTATSSRARSRATCGLAFDQPRGPLVAVCGLAGGAGASTLALTLARQAATESAAPVLVGETSTYKPGLSVLTGYETPHSLAALARGVGDGGQPTDTFLEFASGLRLIASAPRRQPAALGDASSVLLGQARDAHGLVVLDCGSDWVFHADVLAEATHIVWVVAATTSGLNGARALFGSDVVPPAGQWTEVLVARAVPGSRTVSVRSLRRLTGQRCTRLALCPHDPKLAAGETKPAEATLRALGAIAPILRSVNR